MSIETYVERVMEESGRVLLAKCLSNKEFYVILSSAMKLKPGKIYFLTEDGFSQARQALDEHNTEEARMFYSNYYSDSTDEQGRITIKEAMRKRIGLKHGGKVIVGTDNIGHYLENNSPARI